MISEEYRTLFISLIALLVCALIFIGPIVVDMFNNKKEGDIIMKTIKPTSSLQIEELINDPYRESLLKKVVFKIRRLWERMKKN